MENYSLSDIKAVTDGVDGAFGGGQFGIWILILLFFIMFAGGAWGNRGNNYSGSEQFSDLERDVLNGNCSNGNKILETSCATQKAVLESQYATLLGFKDAQYQQSQCCCDLKNAIHAEGEATRGLIQNNTIQELRDRLTLANDALTTQTITNNIVDKVRPCAIPAYITCSPYTSLNAFNTCGCGCNCFNSFSAF